MGSIIIIHGFYVHGCVSVGCQLTTDGFDGFGMGVTMAFGRNVHYTQQVKTYKGEVPGQSIAERRYSPPKCTGIKTYVRIGNPNREFISASHVERTNLSVRLFNRRFTRLTLGHSKKLANLRYSVALFIVHFNWCRNHSANAMTPAQAAGLTDHAWTIREMLEQLKHY